MAVTERRILRLIILLPPGSAKSTYTSVLFPPWFLAQRRQDSILACSYSSSLATRFGKRCRNIIEANAAVLGYRLSPDSQAADDWATSEGGIYFCAGVGSGIAGHRADLGLIDDPIGSQEDADSQLIRDKQWDWYLNDFVPRLKPKASRVIIANRRHEDDLIGRILDPKNGEAEMWTVIRIPMLAEENDPLGRSPSQPLWPEWFTEDQIREARRDPRTWAGLYQQRPSPEEGDYFRRDWLKGYQPNELPKNLRFYGGGDFAVSEARNANKTCFVTVGIDEHDVMWVLPEIFWDKADAQRQSEALLSLCRKYEYYTFWAEKGHISKSMWPFLRKRMLEERVYVNLVETTPAKGKDVRARPLQGRMSMGMIRFPKFAPWWSDAEHDLLVFSGKDDKSDDFIDALAHVAAGVHEMVKPAAVARRPQSTREILEELSRQPLTWGRLKKEQKRQADENRLAALDW